MTSEYDTPGQLIVNLKRRSTDPVVLRGLDELQMYFSAMHELSHAIGSGKYKKPQCAIGYVQLPASDHWSRMFKSLAARLALMEGFNQAVSEMDQKAREEKEKAEQAKKEMKCYKESGILLCFCPKCVPEMHSQSPS